MTDNHEPTNGGFPLRRPRRLRTTPIMRDMVAETHVAPADLIYPLFIADGITACREISSMPGQYQHTIHTLKTIVEQSIDAGIRCIDLFGVPLDSDKDACGSQAWNETGVLNAAIAELRQEFGNDILIMADTCLDEFTDHGHCGRGNLFVETYCRWCASVGRA